MDSGSDFSVVEGIAASLSASSSSDNSGNTKSKSDDERLRATESVFASSLVDCAIVSSTFAKLVLSASIRFAKGGVNPRRRKEGIDNL